MGRTRRIDRVVEATPEEIWAVGSDWGGVDRWLSFVRDVEVTSQEDEGVGARRRCQVAVAGPAEAEVVEEVTEWDPPDALAFRMVGGVGPLEEVHVRWTHEPVDDGTRVTVTLQMEPEEGLVRRVLAWFVGRRLAGTFETALRDLARAAEAPDRGGKAGPGVQAEADART